MKKVFIATSTFAQYDNKPLDLLKDYGCEYVLNPFKRKLSEEELKSCMAGVEYVIAGTEEYTKSVLDAFEGLRIISRCGAGLDNIDTDYAKKLGVKIFNTPEAPVLPVAELTIGLIICLLRKVSLVDRSLRSGIWRKEMGNLLSGKRVGIVGMGRIGNKVVELLRVFNCQIAYTDPAVNIKTPGLVKMALNQLLGWADIILLHASGKETILGKEEISIIKKGAWLVNVARGNYVDETALYEALQEGELSGAALDVFTKEPYKGPLAGLDNVIVTSHIGSYAIEARMEMETQAVSNLLGGLTL